MQSMDASALVPAQTCISDLVIGKRDQVIEAMVYRKWIAKSLPDMTETDYVCMLIDNKGNAIHATMDRNLNYFDPLLVLGKVYRIYRFSCDNTSAYQQSIQNPITLRFGKIAKFDTLEGKEVGWPHHYFEFLPFRELSSRVPYKDSTNKTIYPLLTDYIGRIRCIGDLPPPGNATQNKGIRRKIDIENLDGTIVELTLWDDLAARFPKAFTDTLAPPVIISVSSCRVMKYRGTIQLSAMPATHYYVNPKIPEKELLVAGFKEKFKKTPPLQVSKKHFNTSAIEGTTQIQTLEALVRHPPSGFKGVSFVVQATITSVIQNRSWYYVSCTQCKKQPIAYDGVYECEDHGELEGPSFRYNFTTTVHDGTAPANFTFFSPAGDEVTGHPCSALAAKYADANKRVMPEEITSITGRKQTFQIQFNGSSALGSGQFSVLAIVDKPIVISPPIPAIEGTSQQSDLTIHAPKVETHRSPEHTGYVGATAGTPVNKTLEQVAPMLGRLKEDLTPQVEAAFDRVTDTIVAASTPNEPQAHKRPVRRSILPQLEQDAKKAKKN